MTDTKTSIVSIGDQLVRQKGYNAFSYADISKQLQIKNAAIHYHFPTKTDLGLAIIEQHLHNMEVFKKHTEDLSPLQQVQAFLGIYEKIKTDQKVCLVGAMATDWDTLEPSIRNKMQTFTDLFLQWLTAVLEAGLQSGAFRFVGTAHTKALMLISNMLAATQLARITGVQNFETIKAEVLNGLNTP